VNRRAKATFFAALASLLALPAAPAWAQPSTSDRVGAEVLFNEGRQLMAAKKYAEACAKLAESLRLDPALGTRMNLASCYEHAGQTASAWILFRESMGMARLAGQADRERVARQHAEALEKRLSKLTVAVSPASEIAGLEVRRDGELVPRAEWGTALPVDPGAHTIEASAPGHARWSSTVQVAADAGAATATVPLLEVEEVAREPAALAPAAPSPRPPPPSTPPDHVDAPANPLRVAALVGAGVAVAGLGVGTYFGLHARARNDDAVQHCPTNATCDAEGLAATSDAKSAALHADIAFAAAGTLLAGSVALYLLAPSREKGRELTVAPAVGRSEGGLVLKGAW
jgi:hypothetical protein